MNNDMQKNKFYTPVRLELLSLLFDTIPANNMGSLLLATLSGLVYGITAVWIWVALVAAVALLRQGSFWLYKKRRDLGISKRWYHIFLAGVWLNGLVWAAGLWLAFPNDAMWQREFIAFVIAGLAGGAAVTLASDFKAVIGFLTTILGNLSLWYFVISDKIDIIMGSMVMVYLVLMLAFSRRIHHFIVESFRLKEDKSRVLKRLQSSSTELELIFENATAGVFFYNTHLQIVRVNHTFSEILRANNENLLRLDMSLLPDKRILPALRTPIESEGKEDGFYEGIYHAMKSDRDIAIRMRTKAIQNERGEVQGVVGIVEDISEDMRQKQSLQMFAQFYTQNPSPVFQIDCHSQRVLVENGAGRDIRESLQSTAPELWDRSVIDICEKKESSVEMEVGEYIYLFDAVTVSDKHINLYGRDITQERLAQKKADFLAYYDELTKLPRRSLFMEFLKAEMLRISREGQCAALIFLDLDNFKQINDTMGHDTGDDLLVAMSERLKLSLRKSDKIGRFGGDEFLILLGNLNSDQKTAALHVQAVAAKILAAVKEPFEIRGHRLYFSASIGVTIISEEKDPFVLLKEADAAMYVAKNAGKDRIHFYDENLDAHTKARTEMMQELHTAIENREFMLYYQPQISLRDGRCIGAEALIRWKSPTRGLIPPDSFIPLAEESGVIHEIGQWVLLEASQSLERLHALDHIAVNVSVKEFMRSDYVEALAQLVKDGLVDTSRIELELTESLVVEDFESSNKRLNQLEEMGFKLSIDDFGTGYSSLVYLKKLSLDSLKIDRGFVRDIGIDEGDEVLSRTIIDIAKHFGMSTIAEGIENETQLKFLKEAGCDIAQGYYFAKPMPLDEMVVWLENFKGEI